ncbi:MAG: carboxypeptidase-like regulatory domain-containing protein, partial [Sorangiineae bacterium]|nr:carboxypeptidase-like regulatory domain-containing protein [Sorangiineae bacterium]
STGTGGASGSTGTGGASGSTGTGGASGSGGDAGASGGGGTGGAAGSGGGTGGTGGTGGNPGGPCSAGARRCASGGVEICNSSGTAWLYLETCAVSCASGLCTGACEPGATRCNGAKVEECDSTGSKWNVTSDCGSTYCDATTVQCALPGLDVTSNRNLDGVVVVKGAVVVRSGATLTSPSGDLTLIADSITVENGGSIVIAPTGAGPDGKGFDGTYFYTGYPSYTYTSSGGGGGGHAQAGANGTYGGGTNGGGGGAIFGLAVDSVVLPGAPGGKGGAPSAATPVKGGMGGGVLRLIAPVIDVAGQLSANGQDGGTAPNVSYVASGGGGSGGAVLIAADKLTLSGAVSVAGGSGGPAGGGYNGGAGGKGGDGRVKLLYGIAHSITGSVVGQQTADLLPPLTITSSTHPESALYYNDDFTDVSLAWNQPFPSVQGYYQLFDTGRATVPTPGNADFLAAENLIVPRTQLVQGANYFHVVPVDGASVVGRVEGWFRLNLNTVAPSVTSSSHGSQTTWSANHTVFYSWTFPVTDESVVGAYYVRDAYANTVPTKADTFVPVTQKQQILSGLPDGVWFFHLVSVDTHGYLTKKAAHYQVRLGADPGVGTLLGQVIDGSSQPVDGATITLNRGLMSTTTNGSGNYNLQNAIAGTWEATATKVPLAPVTKTVTITVGGSTTQNFQLN